MNASAYAQPAADDSEISFLHVDENGEEIFGPGYMPRSPDDAGLPYLIGRPNAGIAVPAALLALPQEAFHASLSTLSMPSESISGRALPGIPLRRAFAPARGALGAAIALPAPPPLSVAHSGPLARMRAHFVNVGQGDATILEFPCQVAVIDVGGQYQGDTDGAQLFIDYLTEFFAARPHLNDTIDVVFLTHPHADHVKGAGLLLDETGEGPFDILSVVDNGQTGDSGTLKAQTLFRDRARANGAAYSAIELARQVVATGVTNAAIDPIICPTVDPVITAFWGGVNEQVSTSTQYTSPNNHSVIVRVDFGQASFLFTGDLQDQGEGDLREQYADNLGVFDVDIYHVSHHGADDDTSDALMGIMTPRVAVISMGDSQERGPATAWDHGHPRLGTIAILQDPPGIVSDARTSPGAFPAASAQETDYQTVIVERAIYGTGWEGTIIIEADTSGNYQITQTGFN
ncbi:MAG: MBL fold metallo-hydrolase [Cucumibacter sp.]